MQFYENENLGEKHFVLDFIALVVQFSFATYIFMHKNEGSGSVGNIDVF